MKSLKWIPVFLFSLSSCSTLMGDLRDDLDDRPPYARSTSGGVFPEGNFLDRPVGGQYPTIRSAERRPASVDGRFAGEQGSWVNRHQHEANQRDLVRGNPSYRSNPNYLPQGQKQSKNGYRVTRKDFIDSDENEGSLWASNGQTNYYFTKNKIRSVGDIVTITIDEKLINNVALEMKKTLTAPEVEMEIAKLERKREMAKIQQERAEQKREIASANGEKLAEEEIKEDQELPSITYDDINLVKDIGLEAGQNMMAEIVGRYPNGNYKVRGMKRIPYGGGVRMLNLMGVARSADISEQNVVEAGKLYEYRLSVFN